METSFLADMQSLSLRIENRCQLPIAEVYSDKAAADVRLYSYWTICSKSENHRHIIRLILVYPKAVLCVILSVG